MSTRTMSEFEVNLKGLKNAVSKEEDVIKDLQKEIEKLDAVISSSALNKSGFGDVVAVALYCLYGVCTGQLDLGMAGDTLIQYLDYIRQSGICPLAA